MDSLQLALALFNAPLTDKRCVDVCCGSGIQGLVAAALGASLVLACDVSARAVRFARFNAMLNGLENTMVVAAPGNCYSPVDVFLRAGCADRPHDQNDGTTSSEAHEATSLFDVILANPPFVAVPTDLNLDPALYVSGGTDGADVVRQLVRGAPLRLARGGCLLLVAQLPNIDTAHADLLGAHALDRTKRQTCSVHTCALPVLLYRLSAL